MKKTKVFEDATLISDISALNLKIGRLALARVTSNWQTDIISWSFTRCYCIQKGHAFLHTPDGDVEMTAGNIYIIPSGYPCGYSGDGEMFKLWSHFTFGSFDTYDVFEKIKRIIILENKSVFIDEIIDAYNRDDFLRSVQLNTMMHTIICEAIKLSGLTKNDLPEYSGLIKSVLLLIERQCHMSTTADFLADKIGSSTLNLQRQFKKEVGIALGQYIRKRIMHCTAEELKNSSLSIREISDKYGFSNQFYFAKVFKKYYSFQPSVYRKNNIT